MTEETRKPGEAAMDANCTRLSLLLRVRDLQDQQSWEEFVELYGPLILRYLRRIGVAEQDALELVQDVFVIVVRHIGSFQYDPNKSFRAWLRKIAVNRAFRFFAERARLPTDAGGTNDTNWIEQIPQGDNALEELIEAEWQKRRLELAVKKVRGQVAEKTWRAFELGYVQGLPYPEIAEQLGMKIGAVYTAVCRVLNRLRKAVEEIDE